MSPKQNPITSSELATLWVIYQKKTLMLRIVEYLLSLDQNRESKDILQSCYKEEQRFVKEITDIFQSEGAAVPVGFNEQDVDLNAPRLFQPAFDLEYLRLMTKIASGIHALHITMSFREDIIDLYQRSSQFAQKYYRLATQYLLSHGILPRSPSVSMPKRNEFAQSAEYTSGFKLFGQRRALNTLEVAYLNQTFHANVAGMELMSGFSQVAREKDVKDYFFRGKDLSKKFVSGITEILLDSDITPASTSNGRATDSTQAPFSDKFMMYNTALLSSFGLGSTALGSTFSLRSDLPLKLLALGKNVFDFALEGGKIMIKHGWLEEPPAMENRKELIKG